MSVGVSLDFYAHIAAAVTAHLYNVPIAVKKTQKE